ncbi:MAG: hypothetical protein O7A63_04835, partial [Acidobacteria bacterium]|nr:hypothetical protein [Acidobacteriota bacterium]
MNASAVTIIPTVIIGLLAGVALGWFLKNRFVPIEPGPSQGPDRETSRKKSTHDARQSERRALLEVKEEWLKTKANLEQET